MKPAADWWIDMLPQRTLVHVIAEGFGLQVERSVEQVAFHQRALAGTLTRLQRRHDSKGRKSSGMLIDDSRTERRRRCVGCTRQRGHAAHRLQQQILPRPLLIRPRRAVAGARAVNQASVSYTHLTLPTNREV